jgi:hypothetical protein
MRHRISQEKIQLQFGNFTTDGEGVGGVILDSITPEPETAIILSSDSMTNVVAFELDPALYHVVISAQQESNINYVAVSAS